MAMESKTCCWAKPATEITKFPTGFNLHEALLYHLVYHRTLAIHLNHLVFLQTYLLGWGILFAALDLWALVAVYAILALHGVALARIKSAPFLLSLGLVGTGAYFAAKSLLKAFNVGATVGLGLAIVLASFVCQLLGHWWFEQFNAPPSLLHGFVAAPVLEGVSFQLRVGLFPEFSRGIFAEVDQVRDKARQEGQAESNDQNSLGLN